MCFDGSTIRAIVVVADIVDGKRHSLSQCLGGSAHESQQHSRLLGNEPQQGHMNNTQPIGEEPKMYFFAKIMLVSTCLFSVSPDRFSGDEGNGLAVL